MTKRWVATTINIILSSRIRLGVVEVAEGDAVVVEVVATEEAKGITKRKTAVTITIIVAEAVAKDGVVTTVAKVVSRHHRTQVIS